jgi:hypothetical protein
LKRLIQLGFLRFMSGCDSVGAGSSAMRNIRTISTGWAELEVGVNVGRVFTLVTWLDELEKATAEKKA